MAEIRLEKVIVTTAGENASATGNTTSNPINGYIEHIYLDFHGDAPGGTTDTTVAYTGTKGGNILVVTNSATDAMFTPRAKPVDNANSAITNAHSRFAVCGELKVTVAQSNALTACVTAYIWYQAV